MGLTDIAFKIGRKKKFFVSRKYCSRDRLVVAFNDFFYGTRIGIDVAKEASQICTDNAFWNPNNRELLVVYVIGKRNGSKIVRK
jgi:hypothetical protein